MNDSEAITRVDRRLSEPLTLDEFRPIGAVRPDLEFSLGWIGRKRSAHPHQALIVGRLLEKINAHGGSSSIKIALPLMRCEFGGRSLVPDLSVFSRDRIATDPGTGWVAGATAEAPELMVEVRPPRRRRFALRDKLRHAVSNGGRLGWLIDLELGRVETYRPGSPPTVRKRGETLDAEPVLPGFRLAVDEIFGWPRTALSTPGAPADGPTP